MATFPLLAIYNTAPMGSGSFVPDPIQSKQWQSCFEAAKLGTWSGTHLRVIERDKWGANRTDPRAILDANDLFQTVLAEIAVASKSHWIGRAEFKPYLFEPDRSLLDVGGWLPRLDRIITDLGRLKAGWDGPGSDPVRQSLLMDMETALYVLPSDTREPDVEVDGSDGSVSLRWWTDDGEAAFALSFTGNGRVHGIASSLKEVCPPTWCYPVQDETKILDQVENKLIKRALLGKA